MANIMLNSTYSDRVKTLCKTTNEWQNCFRPLFIEAAGVCIVLLKKGQDPFNHFAIGGYEDLIPFNNLRCYREHVGLKIDEACLSPNSLQTVGMLIYPSNDPDQGSPEAFWNQDIYIANGVASVLLSNRFSPSPELSEGFDYRHQAIVVRGHAKHVAGEASALVALRNDFDNILTQLHEQAPSPFDPNLKTAISNAQKSIASIQQKVNQRPFQPGSLQQAIVTKLNALFDSAEKMNRLRLYDPNPITDDEIRKEKGNSKAIADKELSPLVQQGYVVTPITTEEVEAMEKGLIASMETVQKLKEIAMDSERAKMKEELHRAWDDCMREFHKIVSNDHIGTAQGPIARIYQHIELSDLKGVKEGCWHLMGQIIGIPNKAHHGSYFIDPTFRKETINLLESEYQFHKKNPPPPFLLNLEVNRKLLDQLREIDTYWTSLHVLSQNSIQLQSMDQVNQELGNKFSMGANNLDALSVLFLNPAGPDYISQIKGLLDEVIPLALARVRLSDQELYLAKQCHQTHDRIHYMDPHYSKQRSLLDQQLFSMLSSYLLMSADTPPNEAMREGAAFLNTYLQRERTYGPYQTGARFTVASQEMSTYINQSNQALNDLTSYLQEVEPNQAKRTHALSDAFDRSTEKLEDQGGKFIEHLKKYSQNENWWTQLKGLADKHQSALQEVIDLRSKIEIELSAINFDSNNFNNQFPKFKTNLTTLLKPLNSLLPRNSQLRKDCEALIIILERPEAAGRMNKKLIDAKDLLNSLSTRLSSLDKGMSPHDRQLRDQALEKLAGVQTALVPDRMKELYVRIRGIENSILEKIIDKPNLHQSLDDEVKKLPDCEEFPDPNVDKASFRDTLFKRKPPVYAKVKELWTQIELRDTLKHIQTMKRDMTLNYCIDLRETFLRNTENLSLSMSKREWVSGGRNIVTYYSWNKSSYQEDPHYQANTTHLRIQ